jgi:hypothetical protein
MAEKLVLRWDGGPDILHRVRNFGGEAWGALNTNALGELSISDVDTATHEFSVSVQKRNIGAAAELLRRLLKRHNLEGDVRIERA